MTRLLLSPNVPTTNTTTQPPNISTSTTSTTTTTTISTTADYNTIDAGYFYNELSTSQIVTISFSGRLVVVDRDLYNIILSLELMVALLGVVGNALMLSLIVCIRQTRSVNGIKFIMSVNVSSIFALTVVFIRSAALEEKQESSATEACVIKYSLYYLFLFANMYNRTLTGIDRYLYISKGLKYHNIMTSHVSKCCLTIIWIASAVFAGSATLFELSLSICTANRFGIIDELPALVALFLLPCLLLAIIYSIIFHWAYKQTKAIRTKENTIRNLILMDDKIFTEEERSVRFKKRSQSTSVTSVPQEEALSRKILKAQRITHEQIALWYRDVSRFVAELEKTESLMHPQATSMADVRGPGIRPSKHTPSYDLVEEELTRQVSLPKYTSESPVDPASRETVSAMKVKSSMSLEGSASTTRAGTCNVMFAMAPQTNFYIKETPYDSMTECDMQGGSLQECQLCKVMGLDVTKTHASSGCKRRFYRSCYFTYFCCCGWCFLREQRRQKTLRESDPELTWSNETTRHTGRHIECTAGADSTAYRLHQLSQVYNILGHFVFKNRRRAKEFALRRAVTANFIVRVVKLLIVICFIFICNVGLWLPLCIYQIVKEVNKEPIDFVTFKALYIVAICSLLLDPVVFGFLNHPLRLVIQSRC